MTSFNDWLNLKEDAPPANNISLTGRLGKTGGGVNNLNRRLTQPLNKMNDTNRVVYMANMVAAVYNQIPPEARINQFIKDFTFLKPKIIQAIRASAAQSQQQQ